MNNPVASHRVSKQIQIVHVIARSFIPKQSQNKRLLRFAPKKLPPLSISPTHSEDKFLVERFPSVSGVEILAMTEKTL